jgi:hypothetical protein
MTVERGGRDGGGEWNMDANSKRELSNIGILPPGLFPKQHYELIFASVGKHYQTHPNFQHFAFAWNGVAHRFNGAIDIAQQMKTSFVQSPSASNSAYRHIEDQNLLYFFCSALSAIECSFYALGAISNFMVGKPSFATEDDKKKIIPRNVIETLMKHFPKSSAMPALQDAIDLSIIPESPYRKLHSLRNVLSHRGQPGRELFSDSNITKLMHVNLPLDSNFIDSHCNCMATVVSSILQSMVEFLNSENIS